MVTTTHQMWALQYMRVMPFIREAVEADAQKLFDYVMTIASEVPNNTSLRFGQIPHTADAYGDMIRRYRQQSNAVILIADAGDSIAGLVRLTGGESPFTQHSADLHINVHPDYRGMGIGSALMNRAMQWAQNNRIIRRVELEVLARNEAAIRLYQRHGFEIEGLNRASYRMVDEDGALVDSLVMARLI
jgi:ribosomal protein S18 acetylase RimI-like enzyme